jgi:GNAT superfamily N-acetyltransferase
MDIRSISPADLPNILTLMREFAAYEGLVEYCTADEERLRSAMFGEEAFVEGLIAINDEISVGYALFYPCFASFRAERGLYLEDIYIKPDHRRGGTGLIMLKEIARLATKRGMQRIDFQVLDWNKPAIDFYTKHGAVTNPDETHFKFSGEAFKTLAA